MLRLRDYRINQDIRDKYAEVVLSGKDFIYPYFVVEGIDIQQEIKSLAGVFHLSIDRILADIKELIDLEINKVLLFGVIDEEQKDSLGTLAYASDGLVCRTIKAIKQTYPQVTVFTDVCMCGYMDHGHCGVVKGQEIHNDETLPLLAQMAVAHAGAGADYVAPSAMMDGQVGAIRQSLDFHGCKDTKILSYSVKYASNLYGPFRHAVQSTPSFGDRKTYQMDYRTRDQALAEAMADLEEGADWLMVKPAHTYLDIIQLLRSSLPEIKLAAYHVSGEYMMIKLAAAAGMVDETCSMLEVLYGIKRAGADYIISYYAKDAVRALRES
ncbi:MAG: porphobilinogen synthase [Candidatus Margulisiibacteriota bacterium]|nr:MAG: delta-aminolevulinic acid dehydratase [Candidatus Margulisbacteria bacterium GWD2_39_127]OGI05266.1 MAG: delta-aminolevulinic acid dehydratase [Candidatus Margulisbacteria bacterium GWF2_38_17]OGI10875.1 MAG: delta-aminolevulinic acid dehydratase [Candidatus Margulisbacteria bacterium GWE2_39_32]PZM83563.1 MAG: porphobilinogen synthase [Candidatus Margulisiibacteriota bacterium]HAR64259.1 porphobilinogen synthase [Candidatus Margulisiibacteriota bacterium]